MIDRPDLEGRLAILSVHAKGKPLAEDVDLDVIARRTPGFTGADLANLLNEAALLAARRGGNGDRHAATWRRPIDRVMAGPERKSRMISEKEKRVIAYHEAGHALVGHAAAQRRPRPQGVDHRPGPGPRLHAGAADRGQVPASPARELRDELAMLLGGRTAEEMVFDDPTTGAQNDIDRATEIARAMVTEYGMSDKLGPHAARRASTARSSSAATSATQADYSDEVAARIDNEMRRLIDDAHDEAREILATTAAKLDQLAARSSSSETLEDARR